MAIQQIAWGGNMAAELKSGKNGGLYITTPPIFDPVSGKSGNLVDFENMQQDQTNQIDRQNKQTITTANTLYTPEAIESYFNFTRNLPEYKSLENDNKFYENARDALLKVPQRQNNVGWIKPLLALSDSMTGSKLMQGYEEPEQLAPTILAYQKAIQDNKKNQLETLLGSMNKYKSGQQATTIGDLSENRLVTTIKDTDKDPRSFVRPVMKGKGKGSGASSGMNVYDKEYLKLAAKQDAKGSGVATSASRFMDVADGLEEYKDDFISPVGGDLFGLRKKFTGLAKPEYTSLVSVMRPEAIRSLAESFKGSMSDADRAVMESLAIVESGTIDENIEKAREFAKYAHVGNILKKMRSEFIKQGRRPSDFEIELQTYGSDLLGKSNEELGIKSSGRYSKNKAKTSQLNQTPKSNSGPKEGDETTLKSGKKAIFKGGKWQLK